MVPMSKEKFVFLINLVIGAIIATKFFYKTCIKLCDPIEYLDLLAFISGGMFTIACIFFGFGSFPSLETINPKIIPENTINAHLSRFKLMLYPLHF